MGFFLVAIAVVGPFGFFELPVSPNLERLHFPSVRKPMGGQVS
jgi:hypothetical protein